MPLPVDPSAPHHEDIYLKLELARSGSVLGEASAEGHRDEIEVVGWSWGMQAHTGLAGTGPAAKASVSELHVSKTVDRSSTAIMAALRTNELVRKAVLSMRKAGKTQQDYLKVTIENARLTSYKLETIGASPAEELSFSFKRISVEYMPQRSDGLVGAATLYQDELL